MKGALYDQRRHRIDILRALSHCANNIIADMDAESVILNATRQYLRLKGWYVMRIQQSIGCHPGISDLIAVKRGMTIFVETKSPKWRGKLSKDQEKFKAEIEAHGGMFYVIDSVDEMIKIVDDLEHTDRVKEKLP